MRRATPQAGGAALARALLTAGQQEEVILVFRHPLRALSSRLFPVYNAGMSDASFDDMKRRIGFTDHDAAALRALGEVIESHFLEITEAFYRWLFADPRAVNVFTGGDEQRARQRHVFGRWLQECFSGVYDEEYYRKRFQIGRTHVRVGLPQEYMLLAVEIVWQEVRRVALQYHPPGFDDMMVAFHKLLTLELAIMLESYKEGYSSQIRQEERSVAEEKLTRSEHLATIGQLAASLAHEIKNPLAGISGAIQVIRDGMKPNDPHRTIIHEILGQIDRLDAAVKDLLIYARPRPPELAPCDLGAIVLRVIRLMRDTPLFQRVRLSVSAEEGLPYVAGDANQLEQLVLNLLVNAVQACQPGKDVSVTLRGVDQMVRMSVKDAGCGMDPVTAVRAFEPFFTTKAKGTGLGLPICRKIVEAHGGKIELQSEVGVGTEVTVDIPQVRSTASASSPSRVS